MSLNSNVGRHARAALLDVYKAEKSWQGWNEDSVAIANELVNILLQLRNAQEPSVWHPNLARLFPDLPEKFTIASLKTAQQKHKQLQHKVSMMHRQIERMQTASETLVKLLPPPNLANSKEESPLVLGTIRWYAEVIDNVCQIYKQAMAMRQEHLDQMEQTRQSFSINSSPATVLKEGSLDSDTQLANLAMWLHSPGFLTASVSSKHTGSSTFTLADFQDLLRIELGIEVVSN